MDVNHSLIKKMRATSTSSAVVTMEGTQLNTAVLVEDSLRSGPPSSLEDLYNPSERKSRLRETIGIATR